MPAGRRSRYRSASFACAASLFFNSRRASSRLAYGSAGCDRDDALEGVVRALFIACGEQMIRIPAEHRRRVWRRRYGFAIVRVRPGEFLARVQDHSQQAEGVRIGRVNLQFRAKHWIPRPNNRRAAMPPRPGARPLSSAARTNGRRRQNAAATRAEVLRVIPLPPIVSLEAALIF